MAAIGMNVSADGRHDGLSLKALNCTWARIAHRRWIDVSGRLAEYASLGINVLLVLDRTSVEEYDTREQSFDDARSRYGAYVVAWEIGNEPDQDSPSSWTMPVEDLVALGRLARERLPGRLIVCGGLASGQPDYLVGQDLSWCDAVAIHPYLKDAPNPSDLEDLPDVDVLVDGYRALGKPVWVSEWGWWGDESRGLQEVDDMIGWAAATDEVAVFIHFCADDAMVPPFGLFRADGSAKPSATAFRQQAAMARPVALPVPPGTVPPAPVPEPQPEPVPQPDPQPTLSAIDQAFAALWRSQIPDLDYTPSDAEVVPALQRAWRQNYRAWGSPVSREIPDADGSVLQTFALAGPKRWREGNTVEDVA